MGMALIWNVAVTQSDHEKYCRRATQVQEAKAEDVPTSASNEAAALYKRQDLSLKEGETIK